MAWTARLRSASQELPVGISLTEIASFDPKQPLNIIDPWERYTFHRLVGAAFADEISLVISQVNQTFSNQIANNFVEVWMAHPDWCFSGNLQKDVIQSIRSTGGSGLPVLTDQDVTLWMSRRRFARGHSLLNEEEEDVEFSTYRTRHHPSYISL